MALTPALVTGFDYAGRVLVNPPDDSGGGAQDVYNYPTIPYHQRILGACVRDR